MFSFTKNFILSQTLSQFNPSKLGANATPQKNKNGFTKPLCVLVVFAVVSVLRKRIRGVRSCLIVDSDL